MPVCQRYPDIMRQSNNFDALRIFAACTVMVSHSIPLSYGSNDLEPLNLISRGQTTAGTIAVCVFFIISGYLITQSFERSRNVRTFLIARALRLLPGLAVVLIVMAFVIGPIISTLPLYEYLASTQPYQYVVANVSLLYTLKELPGVFQGNPSPRLVNGSLWSLPYEAKCYLMTLCLGVSGLLTRYITLCLLGAGCVAMMFSFGTVRVDCVCFFLGGSVIYQFRPPLRGWIATICSVLWLASLLFGGFDFASALVGPYVIIYLALAPSVRLPDLARRGDLSYGTYVWAYPVQQMATAFLGSWACWYLNLAIAMPVVLTLAWASWHFIEAPALKLKSRRPQQARPASS